MKIVVFESDLLVSSFRELGHEVLSVRWTDSSRAGRDFILVDRPLFYQDLLSLFDQHSFPPDLVLWHDVGNIPRVWGVEALDCPTVGYFIDTYCNPWHVPYSYAFDCSMVAQKNALPLFHEADYAKMNQWFPLFCDRKSDFHDSQERDIPVCFVGTVDNEQNILRKKFLDKFAKICPILVKQGAYQPLFARSKIVLNQSAAAELNYRTFEAAACGAAVLTEDSDTGVRDLFTPGESILPLYERGNAQHAAEIAFEMLRDEKRLAEIARRGEQIAVEKHSAFVRAQEILDVAEKLSASVKRRKVHAEFVREKLVLACMFICGEAKTMLPAEIVAHYNLLARTYQEKWDKISTGG